MPRNAQSKEAAENGIKKKSVRKKVKDDTLLFATYLPQICKQVFPSNPDEKDEKSITLSSKTARALSGMLGALEGDLTQDCKRVAAFQDKKSILPVSVQVALNTRLPRQLAKYAAEDGAKATALFEKSEAAKKSKPKKNGALPVN